MENDVTIPKKSFSFDVSRDDFKYLGLEEAFNFFNKQIAEIEVKKKTTGKFGGVFILQGPVGSGKSLVLSEIMNEISKSIVIKISVRRGSVIFEPTDELIQKLDLGIRKNKSRLKKFFSFLKTKETIDSLDFVELLEFIPLYGTIASKAIRLGAKSISMITKRLSKRRKSLQEVALTENEHDKKLHEILEKLTILTRAKPVIIIIDNLHWLQKDDQQIFAHFQKLFSGNLPVLVIGILSEIKTGKTEETHEINFENIEEMLEKWARKKNTMRIENMKKEILKDWLQLRFKNKDVSNEFINGMYDLTSGNLRYIVNVLEFMYIQDMINTNGSDQTKEWVLPEEWSEVLPKNILSFELERLQSLLELETIKTTTDYKTRRRILEKAAVVASPFQAFEVDILERVLTTTESNLLPEIIDFAVDTQLLLPFEYRIEFANQIVHSCLINQLGQAQKSELHYKTARTIEAYLTSRDIGDKYESIYFHQLAKHFEGATESYSESRSLEAQEKVHRYYVLSSMGKFTFGGTEEAVYLLGKILTNIYFNPFEIFNLVIDKINSLLKMSTTTEEEINDFIHKEFFPSYFTLLSLFFLPEIKMKYEEVDLSYLDPMHSILIQSFDVGILHKARNIKKLFKQVEDVSSLINKIVLLFAPITYMFQYLIGEPNSTNRDERLKLIYNEFLEINKILITGFDINKNVLDEAYLYNLVAHYTEEVGKDPQEYYKLGGDSYLKASKLPIEDVVIKARITRNAGWNYLNANELRQAIKAFKTARKIVLDSKLDLDYIRYRIAEYDLRIFQLIWLLYEDKPDLLPKDLLGQLKDSFNQFWTVYFADRKYSSYPQFLIKQFKPLSKALGRSFMGKLESLVEPIPTIDKKDKEFKILIVTNEWDYWLADVVHEKIRAENPNAYIEIITPQDYDIKLNEIKPNVVILFGGPKAPFVGDKVNQIFKGETNFRFLTWRHEAGFGGIWSKIHNKTLHILLAGNDEETIDGTLLFMKKENPWESDYHHSTLAEYFLH